METTAPTTLTPPALLSHWEGQGGIFIATKALSNSKTAYLIAAIGQHELEDQEWGNYGKKIEGADSYHDGLSNTQAMAEAGSELAKRVLALDIDGHTDWHLPSQADMHLIAGNAKHLMQQDECYWISTQYSADHAWYQFFGYGGQLIITKDCELRAVPVRCIQID